MRFNIIYIDVPWSYKNKNTGGSMKSGATAKYKTLTMDEAKSLPIKDISEKDSVIFMWATIPLLPECLDVMKSWGFKYKTSIIWRKIMSLGMGFWFRGQCEILVLGIKGKIKAFRCQLPNFIQTKALRHSEKPEEFREMIIEATKKIEDRKFIEIFARKKIEGWTCLGNEITGNDIFYDLENIIKKEACGDRISNN